MPWSTYPTAATDKHLANPYTKSFKEVLSQMIPWTKRLLLTASFLALIATNILTLTHTAFNAALSGLVGTALVIRTVSSMTQTKFASEEPVFLQFDRQRRH